MKIDLKLLDNADIASLNFVFRDALSRLEDLTPLMAQVAQIADEASEEAFAGERAPDGTPWAPLTKATAMGFVTRGARNAKGKRRGGVAGGKRRGYHPILQRDGWLAKLTTVFDAHSMQHGSNLIYAATQMFGRGGIPARPYLGFGPSHLTRIEDAADEFLWPQRDR